MSLTADIRILIVDDHAIVQQGLAAIINEEEDMTVIGCAKDGIEAIQLFRQVQPDVTLMDLRMPQMGGVEAIRGSRSKVKLSDSLTRATCLQNRT